MEHIGMYSLMWLCLLAVFILAFTLIGAHRETVTLKRLMKRQREIVDGMYAEYEALEIDNVKILKEQLQKNTEWQGQCELLQQTLKHETQKTLRYDTMKREYEELKKINHKFITFIQEKTSDKEYREWLTTYKPPSL